MDLAKPHARFSIQPQLRRTYRFPSTRNPRPHPNMLQSLSDYYRVPDGLLDGLTGSVASGDLGFFSFGPETICYGQCESGVSATIEDASSHDASKHVRFSESEIQ